MDEAEYLGGKVRWSRLPEFEGVPAPGAATIRKLRLPQGDLVQLIQGGAGAKYLAWVELKPGTVRGNHYHLRKDEHYYQLSGEVEWCVEDRDTGERASFRMGSGELLRLLPGVVHAVRPLTPGQAIEWAPEPLDPADTFRSPLL
jgi:mannose-6-phosphate isomerase-like protein (cupin superfamily)